MDKLIREHQLSEAIKAKEELERKLATLQNSIKLISESPETSVKDKTKKGSVLDAVTRHQFMTEEEDKRRESRAYVKQKMQEQAEIRRRKAAREQIFRTKLLENLDGDTGVHKLIEKRLEDIKTRKMQELKAKSDKRKELLMKQLSLASKTPNPHTGGYFYQKALEEYNQSIEQPEHERRLEHILKKKSEFKPLDHAEIALHAQKHDLIVSEIKQRKERLRNEQKIDSEVEFAAVSRLSRISKEVIERDLAEKEAREKAERQKRQLANKRRQYGELVKEMYAPVIDLEKQAESQAHSEPQRVRLKKNSSLEIPPVFLSPQRPKPKPQPTLDLPSPLASKSMDYLAQRRQSRGVIDYDRANAQLDPKRLRNLLDGQSEDQQIKQETDLLEKQARRQELKLQAASPTNLQAIELSGSVSDVIISSIRAKLALLSTSVQ